MMLLAIGQRSLLAERREDVEDIEKRRTAHAHNRNCLLVAIDRRGEMIPSPMIYQNSAKRRIVRDWIDLPFFWKVMISRPRDQHGLLFAADPDFGDRSQFP